MVIRRSESPVLSICCITYNHERYIRECIEGFLLQRTDFPIEIIIHDDASSDGTPEIVREYAKAHPDLIVPLFQKENQYVKGKKIFPNFVLPVARGKYVALCEGDDYWTDPNKLQMQVDFLDANPAYVMCYHDAKVIDEKGKIIKESKLPEFLKKDFSGDELIRGKMILTLTLCYRNLLKDFPQEMSHAYNGDKFLTSLLGRHGKGKYLPTIEPAVYRKHSAAVWSGLDEVQQIFQNGNTRAWLYRYYHRNGQQQYADYFKEEVVEHFRKVLKAISAKNGEPYRNILDKILTQYPDITNAEYEKELRKYGRHGFSKKNGDESGLIHSGIARTGTNTENIDFEACHDRVNRIVRCGSKEYECDDILQIDWIVTRKCNYTCSYCTVHDNANGFFAPLEKMKKAADRIASLRNSKIRILLAGGEPTIHPGYINFIEYLSERLGRRGKIVTQTNLSLNIEFYKQIVDRIRRKSELFAYNTSYHYDHADKNAYIRKARYLSDNGINVVVKLCAHPLYMDDIKNLYNELLRIRNSHLKTELVVIRQNFGIKPDERYSKNDLDWIRNVYKNCETKAMFVEFLNPGNLKLYRREYTPNEIITYGLNKFKGMICNAGINMISINANGDLDPAVCFRKVKKKKPNIYDENDSLTMLEKKVVCPFEACGVPADLYNLKSSPGGEENDHREIPQVIAKGEQMTIGAERNNEFENRLNQKAWSYKKNRYEALFQYVDFFKIVNSPAISIIVISWRLHEDTIKNFKILEKQRKQNFELIFVDNGGQHGEFNALKPFIDTYIRLNSNSGAYLARNIGAVFSKAPILLFLEDDGLPERNLVEAHIQLFHTYDIIACRGVYSPKTDNALNHRQGHYYVGDREYPTFAHVEGNTSYLAKFFFAAGGWDDEIRFGGGGLELYFRLLTIEPDTRKQIYSPRPIIYHDYAQNEEHLRGKLEKQKESFQRLRQKYPQWDEVHYNYRKLCGRDDLLIKRESGAKPYAKETNHQINRVLFVNHSIAPYEKSGTPISTWNHCLEMRSRGKEVGVLFPSPDVSGHFQKETLSGICVYRVPRLDKYQAFIEDIQSRQMDSYLERVRSVVRDFCPDLVHINDYVYMPAGVVRLFHDSGCLVVRSVCNDEELCHWDYPVIGRGIDSRLCSGPESAEKCSECFITNRVSGSSAAVRKTVLDRIMRRRQYVAELYRSAVDGVIFTESNFKEHFKKFIRLPEEKIRIIPRGFQFDFKRVATSKCARPTVRFAFIGNIMFSKGIDVALRAFETAGRSNRFELHIYGQIVNSEFKKWLDKLQTDYPNQFIYHGEYRKEELPGIAQEIDVAIVPSYFDTYNRVVREMLYCGVPVIATDFFGASIIRNGHNGLKVPVGDHAALAQCIDRILNEPKMVATLSEGALQTPIPSLSDEIDEIEKFYDALAEKRKQAVAEPDSERSDRAHPLRVKAIAFYLPQYHPIPENDRWWGKGFTEWTNVAQAKPLFPGHFQPQLPSELGFYDLRLAETRKSQAELARAHGIFGFCYYHYWFGGKMLLERPLQEVLQSGEPDFPFCLCWANENWTRAWDGRDADLLMKQVYSEADDREHIRFLCKLFGDSRYIRIDGRPLFIVYRAGSIPDPLKSTQIWRSEAKRCGAGELYLCRVERFQEDMSDPRSIGFDAAIEFQPDGINLRKPSTDPAHQGHMVYEYLDMVNAALSKKRPDYTRFPCVCPSWDNSARRKTRAVIFKNSSPDLYEQWLTHAVRGSAPSRDGEKVVFINAWNEWGEGCHLEPDVQFGRGFLEATRRALATAGRTLPQEAAERAYQAIQKDFIAEGKAAEALAALEQMVGDYPEFPLAYNDLGVLYSQNGENSKARECYERAAVLAPSSLTILKNLAEFYWIVDGRVEDAIRVYHRILSSDPRDAEAWVALGLISEKSERINAAVDFYRKVLEIESDNSIARERLAAIAEKGHSATMDCRDAGSAPVRAEVSLIIPVYNKIEFTRKCLDATIRHSRSVPYEIIIVDNGSTDGTREFLESLPFLIKTICNPQNRGFAAACNQGAARAAGKYLLFLNNDTEPREGWLEPLLHVLDSDGAVGAVGSKMLFPDGKIQHCGVLIFEDRKLPDPLVGRHVYYNQSGDLPEANEPRIYQALTAACLLVRKAAFDSVGGFDEGYWNGYEDIDLCFKLQEKKWLLVYEPGSVLIHHESKSGPERFTKVRENIERLHGRWIGRIKPDAVIARDGSIAWGEPAHVKKYERQSIESGRKELSSAMRRIHTVSIVILTLNQIDYTKACVESIRKHTPEPHEIIFVDNGSTDATVAWLKRTVAENANYRLIENSENRGFSGGCNQGIAASTGEYVLLLNNDVVVTDNWLGGMLECFTQVKRIGIVGPMTNNISGPQKVPSVDYASANDLPGYARTYRIKNRYRRISNRRIVGFCMLFKRRLIDEIGPLDESFGSGNFEDDDLCLRACLAGYQNVIAGDVFIHHYGSRTFIGNGISYGSSLQNNRRIFNEKWRSHDLLRRFGTRLIVQDGIIRAEDCLQRGDIEKAAAAMLDAIKQAPNQRSLYFRLAEMLIDAKRVNDALGILESLPREKEDPEQLAWMGYCHEALGQDRTAEEFADRALAVQPAMPRALNVKGVVTYKRGDANCAEALFKQAIESDPSFGESYTNLGSLKWAAGEQAEALDLFERGFIVAPSVTDAVTAYHTAASAVGEFERAAAAFREANALLPNDKRLAFRQIAVRIQQENHHQAMALIEQAILRFGADDDLLSAGLEIRQKIGPLAPAANLRGRRALSLCMIVKNEQPHLSKCLMSVKPIVSEIIVVDTGSGDQTRKIAEVFGARVFDFPWTNDFSEARNHSLSRATGDWILVLDADETIAHSDHTRLLKIVRKKPHRSAAYTLITRNYTDQASSRGWTVNDGSYPEEEAGTGWVPSPKVRLFVNDPRIRFVNPVHELVEPTLKKAGMQIADCPVPVHHYGRLDKDKVIAKGKEYYRLGMKKIEETSGDYHALKELAIQAAELGQYRDAVKIWAKAIEMNSRDAVAHMNAGYAHLMIGDYENASTLSKKALELDPGLREAVLNYAGSEFISGDVRSVIGQLEKLLQQEPDYPPALGRIAAAYLANGQEREGLAALDRLSQKGYDGRSILEEQAAMLAANGRNEQAELLRTAAGRFNGSARKAHGPDTGLLRPRESAMAVPG